MVASSKCKAYSTKIRVLKIMNENSQLARRVKQVRQMSIQDL